ncbi:hypothetical protein K450DRAFT_199489 [Umbelopsis ramanniana AG]|uniref:NET domain-containing protein n=1 Tax=Umbelopsis ramanniana AG TaxID=1314678 RepID=A0AAD5EAT3_UMBRA|nr:uncharacterized protein K450DRAFT_199489 [Umbelopsis ramanniana AG]KAI8579485.1 hypothetical protein K450DRAFT_199489 [Umbelopsis ramanniana AG]
MGGVQLAPRDFIEPVDLKQDVAWDQWHDMISAEDLTEEIEHIMMNESVPSWINEWQDQVESPTLESSIFPHTLGDLFGGDEIAAGLYDEMTFYPSHDSPAVTEPELSPPLSTSHSTCGESIDHNLTQDIDDVQVAMSSESESSDSDDEEEEEPVLLADCTQPAFDQQDGSDSEDEEQFLYQKAYASRGNSSTPVASFMQRRQMEESILEKITTQLDAEKLPAILTIIGSDQDEQSHGGEVEIDLTRLDQDRLGRILAYVDACVLEQHGGPSVQLNDYLCARPVIQETKQTPKKSRTRPVDSDDDSDDDSQVYELPKRRRRQRQTPARKRTRKQRSPITKHGKMTEDIIGGHTVIVDELSLGLGGSIGDGPLSLSTLNSVTVHQAGGKSKTGHKSIDPESIAASRPKRRAAVHKRRMLEELLAPSDDDDEDISNEVPLVVHSDEKMDMGVTEDKVIVHESVSASLAGPLAPTYTQHVSDDADEEDIDIMD